MIGITSYGAYIPWYRIDRKVIFQQLGWFNMANAAVARGEKAVASYDEDTLTMAYTAAADCMGDRRRDDVDGLYLASMSLPFGQRQNAVIVSDALDFRSSIRSADFTGSLKSGTTALLSGIDAVGSGSSTSLMVCAADCRVGKPGSSQEYTYGDGAAALLLGNEGVIAEFKGSFSVSHDFIDSRQLTTEKFEHKWEDRWVREEGYLKIIPEAALGLARKYNLQISDFAKIIIACPVAGALKALTKMFGAQPEQIQDNFVAKVGDTGSALSLMMLVAALEESNAGDKILVLSFGNGSDALYFEVTEEIDKVKPHINGIKGHLDRKTDLTTYGKYQVFQDIIPIEVGIRGEAIAPTAMTVLWQQGKTISTLQGVRCTVCGTPQYPKHAVCVNPACGAIDKMEPYRFSDKVGTVVSFTGDNLAFSWDPPQIYGLVDFEEGGRLFLDFTDCTLDTVSVGLPVRMTFRRKYEDKERGHNGYYWKATPVS